MKQIIVGVLFVLVLTLSVSSAVGQDEAKRANTKQQLAQLLEKAGPGINVAFRVSQKQTFNFIGTLSQGLANAQSFEIVISVTAKDTIGFRVYPHYAGGYINVDKVKNGPGLMRLLLRLSDRGFLFWGADEAGDVFNGYTFTLESGFPEDAIRVVLRSIVNSDKFIGELRPFIDGSSAKVAFFDYSQTKGHLCSEVPFLF